MIGQEEVPNPVASATAGVDTEQISAPLRQTVAEQTSAALGIPVTAKDTTPGESSLSDHLTEPASPAGQVMEILDTTKQLAVGDDGYAENRGPISLAKRRLEKMLGKQVGLGDKKAA